MPGMAVVTWIIINISWLCVYFYMTNKEDIMKHDKNFVASRSYEKFMAKVRPRRKLAILTCMDTRLTALLLAALNLKNGDANIIKTAGAVILDPFGATMRSLLISVHLLGAQEIFVIGHRDCGVCGMNSTMLTERMLASGVTQDRIDSVKDRGVDLNEWLRGFDDVCGSVRSTVALIKEHPLIPPAIEVHGFVIDHDTGELEEV